MKITEDVRQYAAAEGIAEEAALAAGLAAKAAEFKNAGDELYAAAPPSPGPPGAASDPLTDPDGSAG